MQNPRLNPASPPRTLNVAYARLLVGHLLQCQPDLTHTLDAAQLRYLDAHDPLARCTLHEWHALMDLAERHLGGRDLLPELAEQFKPWHAGLLGFTVMTSGTVAEVGALLGRFHHLLNDVFHLARGVEGARFFLRLQAASSEHSQRLARLSLMVWAQRLRALTGQAQLKLDVSFEGPAPAQLRPYQQVFGGTVKFEQDHNCLWGDAACLDLPVVSHDATSHSLLQDQALKQLESLARVEDRFVDKLHSLILARLGTGNVALEDVAAALKMPARTLQRRLEEADLSFRTMVDDVRKAHAQHLLRDTRLSLAELASALGFADSASFNRAFKRWTGSSPGVFRRALLEPS
jgi:AraC-like DNA-binding protein